MYVFQPIFICISLYGKPILLFCCGLHNDFPSHQVRRVMQARVTGLDPITQFSGLCKRIFPGNPCLHFSRPHSLMLMQASLMQASLMQASLMQASLCKPALYIVCIHISFRFFLSFFLPLIFILSFLSLLTLLFPSQHGRIFPSRWYVRRGSDTGLLFRGGPVFSVQR